MSDNVCSFSSFLSMLSIYIIIQIVELLSTINEKKIKIVFSEGKEAR